MHASHVHDMLLCMTHTVHASHTLSTALLHSRVLTASRALCACMQVAIVGWHPAQHDMLKVFYATDEVQ